MWPPWPANLIRPMPYRPNQHCDGRQRDRDDPVNPELV